MVEKSQIIFQFNQKLKGNESRYIILKKGILIFISANQRKVRHLVVVVGGGVTGLFAALEAYNNDCDVVLIEKSNE